MLKIREKMFQKNAIAVEKVINLVFFFFCEND